MQSKNPSVLREKLQVLSSLPVVGHCVGVSSWQDLGLAFPTHFSVFFFSFAWCVVVTQPDFSLLRRKFSICNCRPSVSVRRGEFRIFLHCHIEPSPKKKSLYNIIKIYENMLAQKMCEQFHNSKVNVQLLFVLLHYL